MAVYNTKVSEGGIKTKECRNSPVLGQNISTVFLIVVECCTQAVVEEVHVEAIVLLEGLLPRYIRIVLR